MSEKHLTESGWKQLCADEKLKDIGLQKALNAYAKLDAAKSPAAAAETLAEIATLAGKLKKTCQANKAISDYLGEILKEVSKAKQTLPAAKPTEEQEEPEGANIKDRLVSALKKVKSAAPGESIAFVACAAKPCYGVLLAKSLTENIGATHKKVLTDLTGATKFFTGRCLFESNAYTFVVDSVSGGLAKNLKRALKELTEQTYKVRVRDPEGNVIADDETDTEGEEAPQLSTAENAPAAPTPPPAAPASPVAGKSPNAEALAKFTARFKALQPDILKAIATKTPQGDEIKRRTTEAGALAKSNDFDRANDILDTVEHLITNLPVARPVVPPAGDTVAPAREIKLSTYLNGRANLRTARENAAKELQRLQQTILDKCKDEPFYKEVEAGSQKLLDFLAPIDDAVINKLDEAGKCPDPELQETLNRKVCELIQKQLTALRAHPLSPFMEKNPFGKFIIKQPLEVTLSALEKQLS